MSIDENENPCQLFNIQQWIPQFKIDDTKRTALCFRESLMICSKTESFVEAKPIGGYCILVESIGPQSRELLVHVQSSMSIDGHFGGTKVISSATSKFHCLEEKRTEFMYENDGLHEKSIYIGIEDNFYHVKLTRTCPCYNSTESKDLSFSQNNKLISEGVNILLMRYLALINYDGTLSFESISIDGDLVRSNYTCTPSEHMEIDGHFLSVYTIERKMYKEDGTVHTIQSYLTPKGKILRHNWLDVPYVLKINPLLDPNATIKTIKIEAPLRDRWTEDIEMFSKYLNMKSSKVAENVEYLADHPEIKQLIVDYIQTLLVGKQFPNWINVVPIILRKVSTVKPQNVIEFTIQHFKAFAKDPIAWETSMSEKCCDINAKSQLVKEKSDVVCGICGFCIDSNTLEEIYSRSSLVESPDTIISHDCMYTIQSKDFKDVKSDIQGKDNTSTSNASASDTHIKRQHSCPAALLELKRTCDQCETIVTACLEQCPQCLKVFNMCSKCSIIDQILQKINK